MRRPPLHLVRERIVKTRARWFHTSRGAPRNSDAGGPHFHGARRTTVGRRTAASVIAPDCLDADALTKVVLALGVRSAAILRRYQATAFMHDSQGRWHRIGAGQ